MVWSRTILDGIVMCVIFHVTVALVQSKKLFTTAPKEIQTAAQEHFPGARILGWTLLVALAAAFLGAFVYGGWEGIQQGYGLWQSFGLKKQKEVRA